MSTSVAIEEVSGVETEIVSGGQGQSLLFLHGALGLRGHEALLDQLAESFRVIAPSHPGFGRTDWPREFRAIDDLAFFYLDLADRFDLADAILVGSCFGGWIAAEMMVRSTARFDRLVLVDALGLKFGDHLTRDITDIHALSRADADALLFHAPEAAKLDAAALSDDELTAIARAREAFTYFGWKPYMHNPSLKRWLHRIDVPTLVVWGAADGFVTPAYGQQFAQALADSRFETIPEAGHFPSIEQPSALSALIRDFAEDRGAHAAA